MGVNILIVGSGGREHAIGVKAKESKRTKDIFFAPGNAGTAAVGINLDIGVNDFPKLKDAVISNSIDLIVIGPEIPLVGGIHDYFADIPELKDLMVIGPKSDGAMLEGSKDFAKYFMIENNIPTAKYFTVTHHNIEEGIQFLRSLEGPYVLKADGLAAGKGVLIVNDEEEAVSLLAEMLDGKFGKASSKVVIEEFLQGVELSVFIITDGINYKVLPEAKDYKRIGEGDTGLNSGGVGAISPVPFADDLFMEKVESRIIKPTIHGLQKREIEYCGFIFFGLINVDGDPYVIEYNVRLGDPETEAVLPRITSDFVDLMEGAAKKTLIEKSIDIDTRCAATVILVSGGYPEDFEKGKIISGLEQISESMIFHSGTKCDNGALVTNGGRVLAVSSLGMNISDALAKSYKSAAIIEFENMYYRKDLGFDLQDVVVTI